ncbi:hypothetical protein UFOVP71_168 [uncultured Caudovirales phage]|uniref:Uncharacterized protein n=1 Tax=uncultured Caudovirales phage TaxID=2100421 RepID=A0A6J5TDB5_9CAUD|nr:hypothetical protein UFOVP71_168 [uncultured Caudovirales phage]
MITAQELSRITSLKSAQLSTLLKGNPKFESVEFVGLTNASQFCYKVVFDGGDSDKVFITRKLDGTLAAELSN